MEKFLSKNVAKRSNKEDIALNKKQRIVQKFRREYTEEWPCILASSKSEEHAFCSLCSRNFSVAHGGRDDCRRHISTKLHEDNLKNRATNKNLDYFVKNVDDETAVTKAELLFMSFITEHNLPISCVDHAGALFRKMFPDSKIAAKYGCGRTKTTAILRSLADSTQNDIRENLRSGVFSLATDGSTDNNDVKIYPIVTSYVSNDKGKIVTSLLTLLECTDNTGEGIFNIINEEFSKHNIPWKNCVAFSSDNARVMDGRLKGVLSFIREVQPNIKFQGCACHLIHLAAKKGCEALEHFSIDQFLVDIYYYFQKSSKRKHNLKLCQSLFGVEPHKILKYVSTRWLSLLDCINRTVEQWDCLKLYFSDQEMSSVSDKKNSQYQKIKSKLDDPISKAYLLFLKNVLPLFVSVNIFLQQERPLIHKLNKQICELFMGLIIRFVKPSAIDTSVTSLVKLSYEKKKNQKCDNDLVIGGETRACLKNASGDQVKEFFEDVRSFYVASANYIKKKLHLDDPFTKNAAVADVTLRKKMTFASIEFLISQFPDVLTEEEKSNIEIEFSTYQFENFEDIDIEKNLDEVWYEISQISDASGKKKYSALSKIILALLLVPNSNAPTERIFSLVRKNQTDFRPTLGTVTLTALLVEKVACFNSGLACHERKFSDKQIKDAKKATWANLCAKKVNENTVQQSGEQ